MAGTASLPQLGSDVFLTDGGIETDLIFNRGIELPDFAKLRAARRPGGRSGGARLLPRIPPRSPRPRASGLVFETLTWRASSDWGPPLGYDAARLRATNERAVEFLRDLRDREAGSPMVVSGCIGPRGDAYSDLGTGDVDAAERYHRPQIEVLAGSGVDLVTALTITNPAEAIGIAWRRRRGRHSRRHLVHGRDRWCAPDRYAAARRDRGGRRRDRRRTRVLHGQLRASRPLRRPIRGDRRDHRAEYAVCGRMHHG